MMICDEGSSVWDGTRFIMVISLTDSSEPKLGWPVSERSGSESVPVRGGLGCEERTSCVQSQGRGLLGWAGLVAPLTESEEARPDIAPHQLKWSIKTDGKNAINFYTSSDSGWLRESNHNLSENELMFKCCSWSGLSQKSSLSKLMTCDDAVCVWLIWGTTKRI